MADAKGKAKNIAGRVREAVEPLVTEAGYVLWDVTYYKEAAEFILEVAIDKEGGISTDDCAEVTKLVDPLLDEMDPIEDSYCLMVSSAGEDRELREESHFAYAMQKGCPVTVKIFAAVDGKKQFEGKIVSFDEEKIVLQTETEEKTFEKKQIAKISALCEDSVSE